MQAFNGLLVCENGIISTLLQTGENVNIIAGGKDYLFENAFAYPGFVDGHGHLLGLGMKLKAPDLTLAKSAKECALLATSPSCRRGAWIYAFGWNHERWDEPVFPNRYLLDEFFPDNPVCLIRQDGHCAWVNSKALKILGYSSLTSNPSGGEILKDENEEPTGILIDNAINAVLKKIEDYTKPQIKEFFAAACADLAANGVTEICDMDVDPEHISIYTELENEGKLPIRIQAYVKAQGDDKYKTELYPFQTKFFHLRGVKFFLDGAIGSRGANFFEEYSDAAGNFGLELISEEELYDKVLEASKLGYDTAVHAIGDKAVSRALNVFGKLRSNEEVKPGISFRIEHAQFIRPEDLPKFKEYDVIASIQPIHFYTDASGMVQKRVGEDRMKDGYRWKSLIDAGAKIMCGSDFPIETHNAIEGIRTLIKRIPIGEQDAINPDERLDLNQAVESYCINPRYALRCDQFRGYVKIGYDADIVVLDKNLDLLIENPDEEINVLAVFCAGKLVYKK